jgi:hypothetical protein
MRACDITSEFAKDKGFNVYDYDDIEDLYLDYLNEFPEVDVFGFSFLAGDVLKELDPTAFRCGCSDWSSEEFTELEGGGYMRRDDFEELEELLEEEEEDEEED